MVFVDQWIFEILSGSWQKAYFFDPELIKEIQYEVNFFLKKKKFRSMMHKKEPFFFFLTNYV